MQTRPLLRFVKMLSLVLVVTAALSFVSTLLLPRLLDLNRYRTQIVTALQQQLNRPVSLGSSSFVWLKGPSFVFNDLLIKERDGSGEFLAARRVSFRLALRPLLNKQIDLHDVTLDGLRAVLRRDRQGKTNIDDLLKRGESAFRVELKALKIKNGTLRLQDQAVAGHATDITLSKLELSLTNPVSGGSCIYSLQAALDGGKAGNIKSSGVLKLAKTGASLFDTVLQAKLELDQVAYWRFWPYFGQHVPFPSPGGRLDLQVALNGRWQDLQAKGELRLHDAEVAWPEVFHNTVAPKLLEIAVDLRRSPYSLSLDALRLRLDGFAAKGTLRLNDLQSKDPSISVSLATEPFDYQVVKSYIPFGIIPEGTSDFIERRILGGIFCVQQAKLNSRFSQLKRFGLDNNARVLALQGTVERGQIQYGEKTPLFRDISGILEMKERDFNLTGMRGTFGEAPFTLDGSIREYATSGVPTRYQFAMQIAPHPAEVAWLTDMIGINELRFRGTGTSLRLEGDGPSSAYRVAGEWQLDTAAYAYPLVVDKPAGMANKLAFSAVLDEQGTRFTSISYQLPPLTLSGNGLLTFINDRPRLSFDLTTNRFAMGPRLPILPHWQQYQLQGDVQAHVLGQGDPRSLGTMSFSGGVKLARFSLQPHRGYAPLTDIATQLTFKGKSLETGSVALRYGSTPLQLKGYIADLQHPKPELIVTSPELHPQDFGLSMGQTTPQIRQFSAQVGFNDELLLIRNISGKLPKTQFSASGTVRTVAGHPEVVLQMASSSLDLDELIKLMGDSSGTTSGDSTDSGRFRLKTRLTAETGRFLGADFSKLSTFIETDGKTVKLPGLTATMLGGKLTLHGQMQQTQEHVPAWDLTFQLERGRAGDLLQLLGIRREIQGLTTVKGSLTASGDSLDLVKKTARGVITIRVDRGTLRRFNTLSKIISLLNVSQLLRFRLPDMANDGMPFNKITASIGVKDGLLTTEDFFIDSNVMNVSTVGSIDIVGQTIDMLIGVQPLQTVDKLVNRLPVVGWILSGGDGSLVTTYFEAKGSLDNPEVGAIPVKGIATGAFNIFRRIFELPIRLFTETGEVLLGTKQKRPQATGK